MDGVGVGVGGVNVNAAEKSLRMGETRACDEYPFLQNCLNNKTLPIEINHP